MNSPEGFQKKLEAALALELPYALFRPRRDGTPAAVLALFAWRSKDAEPSLLLTRRTDTVETHKGQIAFPGGVCDDADFAGNGEQAGHCTTALRETEEEMGIPRSLITVVGRLPDLWTVTKFSVTPFVGLLREPMERVELLPNPAEIAEAFWVPLSTLTHPETYREEKIQVGPASYPIDVYQVGDHRVWGATGSIIKNLLDRINTLR